MKLAIIADIHSNLEALEAVLAEIEARSIDALYCLGDVVGYNVDAATCVDRVQAVCAGVVRGNHDEAVATGRGLSYLPRDGQAAVAHNREQLSEAQRAWLAACPLLLEADGCTFVHATPERPGDWLRVDAYAVAQAQFDHFSTPVCFTGHTHIPAVLSDRLGVLRVRPGHRYLINAGSVGQPRDGDPRAAFALFDTEAFVHETVRVPYHVDRAAEKIRQAGLPIGLARRLYAGR